MNKKAQYIYIFAVGGILIFLMIIILPLFQSILNEFLPGIDKSFEDYGLLMTGIYLLIPSIFIMGVYSWVKKLMGK